MIDTPKEVSDFSARLRLVIGTNSVRGFSSTCELSDAALRSYLDGNTFPTLDRLYAIATAGKVCFSWLATGEGPMRPGEAGPRYDQATEDTATETEDIGELLKVTHKVLTSRTIYKKALQSNIVAFGRGVDMEMEMEEMKGEMRDIKALLQELVDAKRTEQTNEKKSQAA